MVEKDVEMFLEACELKGLSMKTIGSYEQTLRLFMQHLYKIGIERTENVTHLTIQGYIQEIRRRGKYTAVTNQDARNYPENRPDYGKQVSDVTINNYLRNLRVFFNWCVDEDIFKKEVTKMDEMMNMNETTMENETSVEVVPEENVQMIDNEETSSNGSGIGLAVGAVGLVAAVGYGLYRKHKAKKQNKDEEKPKTKKKIVWQKPWKLENVDSAQVDVPDEDVEETSEEK